MLGKGAAEGSVPSINRCVNYDKQRNPSSTCQHIKVAPCRLHADVFKRSVETFALLAVTGDESEYQMHACARPLCFWICHFFSLNLKQHFEEWTLTPSAGGTNSVGPYRLAAVLRSHTIGWILTGITKEIS
jgi:hypothetical protein